MVSHWDTVEVNNIHKVWYPEPELFGNDVQNSIRCKAIVPVPLDYSGVYSTPEDITRNWYPVSTLGYPINTVS